MGLHFLGLIFNYIIYNEVIKLVNRRNLGFTLLTQNISVGLSMKLSKKLRKP